MTSRPELFQALVRFADGLDAAERLIFELEAQGTDDWKPILQMLLDQFFPKGKSWWAAPDLESLRTIVVREAETARDAALRSGRAQPIRIPFPVMWSSVTRRFKSGSVPARPTGAIAISSMDALRGIPFKAICVVGLDAASGFPGTVQLDEFDLMGLPGLKRRGDRDSRRDNRNIFFDLIMSARSWFSVFYAEGPEKERPLPPSEVVTDFRGFLADLEASRAIATGTEAKNTWDAEVPLARYSRRNFTKDAEAKQPPRVERRRLRRDPGGRRKRGLGVLCRDRRGAPRIHGFQASRLGSRGLPLGPGKFRDETRGAQAG